MNECKVDGCTAPVHGHGLCSRHYQRARFAGTLPPKRTTEQRFWDKVAKGDPGDCWYWTAALSHANYGVFLWRGVSTGAHRVAWELTHGPVPAGLELDHVCHSTDPSCVGGKACLHRRCVNPAHLEPVTPFVNWQRGQSPHAKDARKTHCAKGHEFTPENTVIYPSRPNQRVCLTCKRASGRATQRKRDKEEWNAYIRSYRERKKREGS